MRPHPRFTPVPADRSGRRDDPHDGHDPYLQHRPGNHGCDHRIDPDPAPPHPAPSAGTDKSATAPRPDR